MAKDTDQGAKNLSSALSGDTSLNGASKEQVAAMGGEIQDDLDGFDASKADRGDSVEPAKPEEDRGDKVTEPEDTEEKVEETKDEEVEETKDEEPEETKDEEAEEDEPAKTEAKEEEAEEEPEPEPEPKKQKEENRIPKSRFDEVNARRKAAEDELAALKAQQKAKEDGSTKKFDFAKSEREYMVLALDGKIDEALAIRQQIDAAKEAEWEAKQTSKASNTVTQREHEREINGIVEQYEAAFPAFNPESEEFSEDIVDDVKSQYIGYLQSRSDLTPPQAFKLALHNAIAIYDLKKVDGTTAGETEKPAAKTKVVVKEKKDTKAKIAIAKKAPKNPNVAGEAGDKGGATAIDIENITDSEFNALPESTKARLRGDFFEG